MSLYVRVFLNDLTLAFRNKGEFLNPLIFFGLVVLLFPIGISASESLLKEIAPGLVWIAALLAVLMSLDMLFKADYNDGTIEQWVVSDKVLAGFVFARLLSHWVVTTLPLILLAPIFSISVGLPFSAMWVLILSLILGSLLLVLIGGMGVALTIGLSKSSMLTPLLVIPFYVPVLIFGASAVEVTAAGWSAAGQLYVLAGLLVLALTLAPLTIAAALKISVSQ